MPPPIEVLANTILSGPIILSRDFEARKEENKARLQMRQKLAKAVLAKLNSLKKGLKNFRKPRTAPGMSWATKLAIAIKAGLEFHVTSHIAQNIWYRMYGRRKELARGKRYRNWRRAAASWQAKWQKRWGLTVRRVNNVAKHSAEEMWRRLTGNWERFDRALNEIETEQKIISPSRAMPIVYCNCDETFVQDTQGGNKVITTRNFRPKFRHPAFEAKSRAGQSVLVYQCCGDIDFQPEPYVMFSKRLPSEKLKYQITNAVRSVYGPTFNHILRNGNKNGNHCMTRRIWEKTIIPHLINQKKATERKEGRQFFLVWLFDASKTHNMSEETEEKLLKNYIYPVSLEGSTTAVAQPLDAMGVFRSWKHRMRTHASFNVLAEPKNWQSLKDILREHAMTNHDFHKLGFSYLWKMARDYEEKWGGVIKWKPGGEITQIERSRYNNHYNRYLNYTNKRRHEDLNHLRRMRFYPDDEDRPKGCWNMIFHKIGEIFHDADAAEMQIRKANAHPRRSRARQTLPRANNLVTLNEMPAIAEYPSSNDEEPEDNNTDPYNAKAWQKWVLDNYDPNDSLPSEDSNCDDCSSDSESIGEFKRHSKAYFPSFSDQECFSDCSSSDSAEDHATRTSCGGRSSTNKIGRSLFNDHSKRFSIGRFLKRRRSLLASQQRLRKLQTRYK